MFPTRINVGQLLLTFGRYVAIGAVEGLPEKHTPVHKYILDGVEPEDLGFILKGVEKRRRELGMTQLDLKAKAGICVYTITKVEGGRRVSYETASRIALALGVPIDSIIRKNFGDDEEEVCDESTSEYQNT